MSLWKNKNFTLLYFGQLFSVFGDWLKTVTLITFIYYLTNDARTTGLLFILAIIPQIVVSFFSGPLIDKFNKKHLIIFLDIIRFVLGLALVYATYLEDLLLFLTIIFVTNIFSSVFIPTRSSFIPLIIDKDHIVSANSTILISFNVIMVVATAIGGLLSEIFGVLPILFFSAFTYLVSGLFIMPINFTEKKKGKSHFNYWKDLKDGLQATLSSNQLKSTFLLNCTRDFVLGAVNIMFNAIILTVFLAGNEGIGFGYAATALAYIAIGLFIKKRLKVTTLSNVSKFSRISLVLSISYGLLLALGFSSNSFILFLLLVFLMNLPQGTMSILFESSVMYNAKDDEKGRVFSLLITITRLGYLTGLIFYMLLGNILSLMTFSWILCILISIVGIMNFFIYKTTGKSLKEKKQVIGSGG